MAAEREEAVSCRDAGGAGELGEQGAEQRLVRRGGGDIVSLAFDLRSGQGAAVELAVDGQRQLIEGDEGGGDHVVGQAGGQRGAQLGGRGTFQTSCRDEIGDEPFIACNVAYDDSGLADALKGRQGRGYLAGLDAETADLDLIVGAAEEVEDAVLAPAGEVAGAVHARARLAERAGDKALGGQARTAKIAPRQPRARNVELARHTHRDRTKARVEKVDLRVPDRGADCDIAGAFGAVARRAQRRAHCRANGCLSRTIGVDHPPAGRKARHKRWRAGFAGDDQRSEARAVAFRQHRQQGRRQRGGRYFHAPELVR